MPKSLRVTLVAIVCLIGLLCGLATMRREWVTPRSGVRMSPARPILKAEDVTPGSAFDLFARAVDFSGLDADIPVEELQKMDSSP